MALTRCIQEYWGVHIEPPFPCVLQLVGRDPFSVQVNGLLNWRVYLSDGHYISTNFVYMPDRGNAKSLPAHNSVIEIWSGKNGAVQRPGYFYLFDDFEVVAKNNGRISRIGNPLHHENDEYAPHQFD